MSVLFMRISAPMQSWGSESRFSTRLTGKEPTKSGIIGMICSAMGKPRAEASRPEEHLPSLRELAGLRMAVRVDREGKVMRDFHTAGGGFFLKEDYGVARANGSRGGAVVSNRYYLSDAVFLVMLEGEHELLARIDRAIRNPVWPICFGRRSFVPSAPVFLPGGLVRGLTIEGAVFHWPYLPVLKERNAALVGNIPPERLRVVLECGLNDEGEIRHDVPVSFESGSRRFAIRKVRETWADYNSLKKGSGKGVFEQVEVCT